ncbi:hypothetical protein EDD53_1630 [Pacificibacter maritimus]|uniref:DUF2218 domain-containing protein n=1 Tax=Pacificibacter maritimus TaxID=762213 RepID=A0A3N4UFI7_9RHOB|nr:DUF2218 domain-containing protein [Pacificibacter maritimus]RPE67225.1 hypothetical protein EDD53_1630 [Pacificibacter maritimus]
MQTSQATLKTENGSKYLQQLCKHFGHKGTLDITFTPEEGKIIFPFGPVNLKADAASLWIEVNAPDAEGIARAKDVVDRHLERFAFREEFKNMPWES